MRKQVSSDEFYAALRCADGDIMPVITNARYPYAMEWRCQKTKKVFGWTIPTRDYDNGRPNPDTYWLAV